MTLAVDLELFPSHSTLRVDFFLLSLLYIFRFLNTDEYIDLPVFTIAVCHRVEDVTYKDTNMPLSTAHEWGWGVHVIHIVTRCCHVEFNIFQCHLSILEI